jgi:hypothetical protein
MAIGGLDSDPTDDFAAIEMHRQEPNSPISAWSYGHGHGHGHGLFRDLNHQIFVAEAPCSAVE